MRLSTLCLTAVRANSRHSQTLAEQLLSSEASFEKIWMAPPKLPAVHAWHHCTFRCSEGRVQPCERTSRALNKSWPDPCKKQEHHKASAPTTRDWHLVPFCLYGATSLFSGRVKEAHASPVLQSGRPTEAKEAGQTLPALAFEHRGCRPEQPPAHSTAKLQARNERNYAPLCALF